MSKPILFAIDDDTEVLGAVNRDLRSEYGERFRIMRADSGERAIDRYSDVRETVASLGSGDLDPRSIDCRFDAHARECGELGCTVQLQPS